MGWWCQVAIAARCAVAQAARAFAEPVRFDQQYPFPHQYVVRQCIEAEFWPVFLHRGGPKELLAQEPVSVASRAFARLFV